MYIVYFHDAQGNKREIGRADSDSESKEVIKDFLNQNNYQSLYWRHWTKGDIRYIDVGSHTEHFTVEQELTITPKEDTND